MLAGIKNIIKKYFQVLWLRDRFSASVQIAQRNIFNFYQMNTSVDHPLSLTSAGYKVFSQFEEDGLIIFILAKIGMKHFSFIEIGADDGINSNCANLALNFNLKGLFIDANKKSIVRGKYFYKRYPNIYGNKPKFCFAQVKRDNINSLIESGGFTGGVDLLSIDIDGNDYWIWDAITVVSPRIVIIETHIIYGFRDIVVPYDPAYFFPGRHPQYHGASPVAMVKLGRKKGYRLIGANQLGFNFIFLRNDEGQDFFPEVSVDSILQHPICDISDIDESVFSFPFETPIK